MTSKGTKDSIVAKLGFKSSSSSSKAEAEVERVRKENAHLRKKIDELAKRHIRPPDADKSKLFERIVSLETLRERNNQQLLVKEQELETVRQQLAAKGGEVVSALQSQLEQQRKDAEQKNQQVQNLSQETENLKNKLATISARCQSLETQANGQASVADLALVQDQLRDALEKNQQWLVYDQQREAFVQSVLARTHELEQQLSQSKKEDSAPSEAAATQEAVPDSSEKEAHLKSRYEESILALQKQLNEQKEQLAGTQMELLTQKEQCVQSQAELRRKTEHAVRLQEEMAALQRRFDHKCDELSCLQRKYKDKTKELEEVKLQIQTERLSSRNTVSEERQVSLERADRMKAEADSLNLRLEEERKRSAELLLQVSMLQKSLLSQNEEQRRIAALEQQIQLSVKDFENEKLDRQSMQHQLHKVLKELRKARDQIAKLESAKQPNSRFSEPSSYNKLDVERLTLHEARSPTSPSKAGNLLDESFLECPRCRASYPTSRHRELLAHIDFCLA